VDRTATAALFAWLDRELWLVTSQARGCRSGLIATSVLQASIVPDLPRVLVSIAQQHFTCELIEHSGSFALHLLGQDDIAWVRRFGLRSGRDVDKLAEQGWTVGRGQALDVPYIVEADLHVECRTVFRSQVTRDLDPELLGKSYPRGDLHTLYFGLVMGAFRHQR